MTFKDRNARKVEVLRLLAVQGGWLSSYEVAEQLGLSWANSANLLRNYSMYGLARRRRVVPEVGIPFHLYSLSAKGLQRLNWLLGHNMEVDSPKVIRPRVVNRVIRPNVIRRRNQENGERDQGDNHSGLPH